MKGLFPGNPTLSGLIQPALRDMSDRVLGCVVC